MTTRTEIAAVAEVLAAGRDFLADAVAFYGATGSDVVAEEDREMVQALTQTLDYLTDYQSTLSA